MERPKVSVIVIVYNVEQYIERCLRSLFEQTLEDIEYIFVDDKTPDKSFEVLEKVANEYPDRKKGIKIIRLPQNSGQSAARTAGMKAATGQYMIHCDPDDWVEKNAYEMLYDKAIATHSDIVACRLIECRNGKIRELEKFFEGNPRDCLMQNKFGGSLCTKLISTNLIQRNNIYPYEGINNGEDLNVSVRIYLRGNKMSFVDRALYHYNGNNSSSITNNSGIEELKRYLIPNVEQLSEEFRDFNDVRKNEFINNLKFNSKHGYLYKLGLKFNDLKFWRRLWPESHKNILKNKSLGKINKRLLYVSLKSDFLIFLYYKLLNLSNFINRR